MGWCEKCEADCHPCACIDDEIAALRTSQRELMAENTRLRRRLNVMTGEEGWTWVGDGVDDLDSMASEMVVTILAKDLRELRDG